MASEQQTQALSVLASGAITNFRAVVVNGERTAALTPDASDADGVAGETVADGEVFPMIYSGVAMIELAATLSAGVRVSSDATGAAVAAGAAGTVTIGKLWQGGVAGDIVSMQVDIRRQHA